MAGAGRIFGRVAEVIGEIADVPAEHLREDARLGDVLGAGTIGMVDLALRIEEAFGVEIGDGEFARCRTPGDLARLVERRVLSLREAVT